MARTSAQRTGDRAETRALRYLEEAGEHRSLVRNYRCRGGEVDLVTLEGEILVFVEVRARSRSDFGLPEETVGWRKRQRLTRAARAFLAAHPEHRARACRFDLVAVDPEGLRWIPDAFRVDDSGYWS